MNIHPSQLKGKTIEDAYISGRYEITIEFTDGTKIKVQSEHVDVKGKSHYSNEDYITLFL